MGWKSGITGILYLIGYDFDFEFVSNVQTVEREFIQRHNYLQSWWFFLFSVISGKHSKNFSHIFIYNSDFNIISFTCILLYSSDKVIIYLMIILLSLFSYEPSFMVFTGIPLLFTNISPEIPERIY